ncbi:MAG: response regulator [Rhodospirillaceae bacterium]
MPPSEQINTGERVEDFHVFIVDDDEAFVTLIHAMLRALGITKVTRAFSGAEAFDKLSRDERVVDCILCDISMENGTGLQLLRQVRTSSVPRVRPDIPFVLVTASSHPDTIGHAAQLDVSGYLVKPVTKEKLLSALKTARRRGIKVDIPRYARVVLPEDREGQESKK